MGGPPSGMRPAVRQGTPKAVPVIVSAGLAVGVFCGLLFGLGTGDEVQAAASSGEKQFVGTKIDGTEDAPQTGSFVTPPKSVTSGTAPTPATGSAAVAGSGSGSAAPATVATIAPDAGVEPAAKPAKLTIEIKPEKIASTAKITVDGAEVTGGAFDVELGDATKKEVKVVVEAKGYKDVEQKVEVEGDTTLKIELVRRSSGGGIKRPDPPGGRGGKKSGGKKSGGGGLIDI